MLHSGLQDNTLHKVFYKILNWVINFNEIWRILWHIKIFEEIYIIFFINIMGNRVFSIFNLHPVSSMIHIWDTLYALSMIHLFKTPCALCNLYILTPCILCDPYIWDNMCPLWSFGTSHCILCDPYMWDTMFPLWSFGSTSSSVIHVFGYSLSFVIHIFKTTCVLSDPLGHPVSSDQYIWITLYPLWSLYLGHHVSSVIHIFGTPCILCDLYIWDTMCHLWSIYLKHPVFSIFCIFGTSCIICDLHILDTLYPCDLYNAKT